MANSFSSGRLMPIIGSVIFFLLAPFMASAVIPWWISGWENCCSTAGIPGWPILFAGATILIDSIRRFALEGLGTPAPVYPTQNLVISGFYRFVRNPMYLAVVSIILGQALILWNLKLFGYGMLLWLCFHIFVLSYEEPKLNATYGDKYAEYCRGVSRWVPTLPH